MGNILDRIAGGNVVQVFIDFENAVVTADEQKTWDMVNEVLSRSGEVIQAIDSYAGCKELMKISMESPSEQTELAAFEGLLKCVESIQLFFNYSKELERVLPQLLDAIGGASARSEGEAVESQQALCKQLADMFSFTLRFDEIRMMRPNLSNDFSYYRRLLGKFGKHKDVQVKDDEASGMAMFTAEHIPMMNCLARAGERAQAANDATKTVLSILANSCLKMIKSKKFVSEDTNLFCARAMTGAIVLYDHIDLLGVFAKRSGIPMKPPIQLLKKDFPNQLCLMNAIHFSTKSFRNAPQSIQDMFD
jgi:hypothetical protein